MEYKDFENIFSDTLPILYKAAPIIASYVGSPVTYIVLGLLSAISHCDPNDHQALATKLRNDPDLYSKLEKLESTHAKWIKDLQGL